MKFPSTQVPSSSFSGGVVVSPKPGLPPPITTVPRACSTPLPMSITRQDLEALREKSVAIKTCMTMTMEEIECLIRGNMVVKVSNRKKPDQSLKYPCKFCIWFNHETNGQVRLRSFGRKEEIKRHHMLHLRYERFQCQYCPYKVCRSTSHWNFERN